MTCRCCSLDVLARQVSPSEFKKFYARTPVALIVGAGFHQCCDECGLQQAKIFAEGIHNFNGWRKLVARRYAKFVKIFLGKKWKTDGLPESSLGHQHPRVLGKINSWIFWCRVECHDRKFVRNILKAEHPCDFFNEVRLAFQIVTPARDGVDHFVLMLFQYFQPEGFQCFYNKSRLQVWTCQNLPDPFHAQGNRSGLHRVRVEINERSRDFCARADFAKEASDPPCNVTKPLDIDTAFKPVRGFRTQSKAL